MAVQGCGSRGFEVSVRTPDVYGYCSEHGKWTANEFPSRYPAATLRGKTMPIYSQSCL